MPDLSLAVQVDVVELSKAFVELFHHPIDEIPIEYPATGEPPVEPVDAVTDKAVAETGHRFLLRLPIRGRFVGIIISRSRRLLFSQADRVHSAQKQRRHNRRRHPAKKHAYSV